MCKLFLSTDGHVCLRPEDGPQEDGPEAGALLTSAACVIPKWGHRAAQVKLRQLEKNDQTRACWCSMSKRTLVLLSAGEPSLQSSAGACPASIAPLRILGAWPARRRRRSARQRRGWSHQGPRLCGKAGRPASRKECGQAGRGRVWMRSRSWRAGLLCGLQVEVSGVMARDPGQKRLTVDGEAPHSAGLRELPAGGGLRPGASLRPDCPPAPAFYASNTNIF